MQDSKGSLQFSIKQTLHISKNSFSSSPLFYAHEVLQFINVHTYKYLKHLIQLVDKPKFSSTQAYIHVFPLV